MRTSPEILTNLMETVEDAITVLLLETLRYNNTNEFVLKDENIERLEQATKEFFASALTELEIDEIDEPIES